MDIICRPLLAQLSSEMNRLRVQDPEKSLTELEGGWICLFRYGKLGSTPPGFLANQRRPAASTEFVGSAPFQVTSAVGP